MSRRATQDVERAVHDALQRSALAGASVVVGFSGGQDSTCLLHALRGHGAIAAHVDHALRTNSAADAARVAQLAQVIGVEIEVVRVDVAAYKRTLGRWSVQQAARAARYQALAAVAQKYRASAIALGHTSDDQAETVLLHLLRGSGLRGLAGMRFDERIDIEKMGPRVPELESLPDGVRVVRPLLTINRPTTLAYCAEQGLAIVEDASNQSRAYMRNRVRLDLLPTLEGYNPKVREVLARTADLLAEDAGALDAIVGALHADIAQPGEGSLRYALDRWRTQPVGIQRRLLRCGLEALLGTVTDVRAQPIEDALGLVRSGSAGRTYHLPYGVELCVGHDAFELRLHGRALPRNSRNTWGREGPRV